MRTGQLWGRGMGNEENNDRAYIACAGAERKNGRSVFFLLPFRHVFLTVCVLFSPPGL